GPLLDFGLDLQTWPNRRGLGDHVGRHEVIGRGRAGFPALHVALHMNLLLSVGRFPALRRNTMKRLLAIALLLVWAAPRSGAQAPKSGPEQELIAIENKWSQASVKRDGAALPRFYADEYIFTDEDGVVSNKTREIANITGGVFKLNSYKFENM